MRKEKVSLTFEGDVSGGKTLVSCSMFRCSFHHISTQLLSSAIEGEV